jgi:hypothetical protein
VLKFLKSKIKSGDFEKSDNFKLDAYSSVMNYCKNLESEALDIILKK